MFKEVRILYCICLLLAGKYLFAQSNPEMIHYVNGNSGLQDMTGAGDSSFGIEDKNLFISNLNDSSKTSFLRNEVGLFDVSGNNNLEYNYGLIPYMMSSSNPSSFYRLYGSTQVRAGMIPLDISYNYSNVQYISGMTNYFNVSFDVNAYKKIVRKRKLSEIKKYDVKLDDLQLEKEGLLGKKYYLESLLDINHLPELNKMLGDTLDPNLNINAPNLNLDSSLNGMPSSNPLDKELLDSKKEKVKSQIAGFEQKINTIDEKIKALREAKSIISGELKTPSQLGMAPKIKDQFLGGIQAFNFGLINPNYSPLFVNGISMQGVNLEWEQGVYISILHGVTINNLFYSIDPAQNQLNYTQNLFNFFDFGNVEKGRRITAFKFGQGKKQGTHIYFGVLKGIGRTASSVGLITEETTLSSQEDNYVLELDARLNFSKTHFVELFFDKSFVHDNVSEELSLVKGFSNAIQSKHSKALLLNHSIAIPKIKTDIKSSIRIIDPYFKNYGLGFIRSDNLRYEVKTNHYLLKKLTLSLRYRKDRDNLLQLFDYQNQLTSFGAQLKWKPLKRLTLAGGYFPVIHELKNSNSNTLVLNKNYIANSVVSYITNNTNFSQIFALSYNNFLLSNDTINSSYQTMQLNYDLTFNKSGNKLLASTQYFRYNSDEVSVNETTLLNGGLLFNITPKSNATIKGKYSYDLQTALGSAGYGMTFTYNFTKYLGVTLSFEKLVQGDFYNTITENLNNDFPYYGFIRITNNF